MTNIADEQCLQATTWRKDGTPVMTPIWPIPWGEEGQLAFVTPKTSGKHKRLKHTPKVKLQASDWDGFPLDGSQPYTGSVELVEGDVDAFMEIIYSKYGLDAWNGAMERAHEYFSTKGDGSYPGDIAVVVTLDS